MIDNVLKYWALLTATAIAVASVYNIGFFAPFGIHFMGLMDISNIVYLAAMVFPFLMALLLIILYASILSEEKDSLIHPLITFIKTRRWLPTVIAKTMVGSFVVGLPLGYNLGISLGYFAIWTFITTLLMGFILFTSWKRGNKLGVALFSFFMFVAIFAILLAGAWIGRYQAFSSPTLYSIMTKDSSFAQVRIVRSSSSGLLISSGERIMFLPIGEIKTITAMNVSP